MCRIGASATAGHTPHTHTHTHTHRRIHIKVIHWINLPSEDTHSRTYKGSEATG